MTIHPGDLRRLHALRDRMRASGAWPDDTTTDEGALHAALRLGMRVLEHLTSEGDCPDLVFRRPSIECLDR